MLFNYNFVIVLSIILIFIILSSFKSNKVSSKLINILFSCFLVVPSLILFNIISYNEINIINEKETLDKSSQVQLLNDEKFNKYLAIESGTYKNTYVSSQNSKMDYYLYIPNNATINMPLFIYLHGDGSVNNLKRLETGEAAEFVKEVYGEDFPFIFIQPHTNEYSWTKNNTPETLIELINKICTDFHCNSNKIILSGGSRGAMGGWTIAQNYEDTFSAFVPISGNGNIDENLFINLPTWAFSSPSNSDSWNFNNMKNNVEKINNAGGSATFTSKPGYNHDTILSGVFTKETFDWMLEQEKNND